MKKIVLVLFSLSLCQPLYSQSSGRMIDEIKSHNDGIKVWWAGHNSWIIKSDDLVITTDLFLEDERRFEPPPITSEEIAEVIDISFVTHYHNDHFNEYASKILSENSDCLFVIPESAVADAERLEIPNDRIMVVKPRDSLEIRGIEVETLRAVHGHANFALYYDANLKDVGYKLTVDGSSFLQPGDTYLLQDHLFLGHVDVLFFSPTEHNMYIDRSVILINTLNPDFIFPQHHSTIVPKKDIRFWTKGYPEEVKIRLSDPLKEKYHIPKPGDSWIIQ